MNPSIASEVKPGQQAECVNIVANAARKATEVAIQDLMNTGAIENPGFQEEVIERADVLSGHFFQLVRNAVKQKVAEMVQKIVGYLKLISGGAEIVVAETDGTETLAHAGDIFTGWVDNDFQKWGTDVRGKPTEKTPAQVFEVEKNATFEQMFTFLGRSLDGLCWEQSQIKSFAKTHANWLHPEGFATFFLFKVEKGEKKKFFVARVRRPASELEVDAHHFEYVYVWDRGWVVVPQLKLKP